MDMVLPGSSLSKVKFSGSPPINTPVFSPIMVLPLEADLLPKEAGSSYSINNRYGEKCRKHGSWKTRFQFTAFTSQVCKAATLS